MEGEKSIQVVAIATLEAAQLKSIDRYRMVLYNACSTNVGQWIEGIVS